ncbi:Hypothetical predicted protein [Scomber scombrus]|uniref:Uncharacterized protein n=1 Tax=Scomber scombrus TaxID=13677 RepID=A0AAV1P197_SCOSC
MADSKQITLSVLFPEHIIQPILTVRAGAVLLLATKRSFLCRTAGLFYSNNPKIEERSLHKHLNLQECSALSVSSRCRVTAESNRRAVKDKHKHNIGEVLPDPEADINQVESEPVHLETNRGFSLLRAAKLKA